jgi:hypothetical protein
VRQPLSPSRPDQCYSFFGNRSACVRPNPSFTNPSVCNEFRYWGVAIGRTRRSTAAPSFADQGLPALRTRLRLRPR